MARSSTSGSPIPIFDVISAMTALLYACQLKSTTMHLLCSSFVPISFLIHRLTSFRHRDLKARGEFLRLHSSQFGEARHAPDDIPQPAEDPDTSATGSTDDRSAENRREGARRQAQRPRRGLSFIGFRTRLFSFF